MTDRNASLAGGLIQVGAAATILDHAAYAAALDRSTGDSVPPVVANMSPAPGAIPRTQAIEFDLTDNQDELDEVIIVARHASGAAELVYDGSFLAPYSSSTKGPISNGLHFSIARTTGWPSATLTLEIVALDTDGNQATPSLYPFTVTNADLTPPVVQSFSPAKFGNVLALGSVSFDAFDSGGDQPDLESSISVTAIESTGRVLVYAGGAFQAPFSGTRSGADSRHFAITRSGGWVEPVVLEIVATDVAGNVARDVYVAHVTGSSASDTTAPTIENITPPPGTQIEPTQAISFDVTDESGSFRRVLLTATLAKSGVEEVVFDGAEFRGLYAGASSRSSISGGYRFVLLRGGGWPSSPTIRAFAIDRGGNETLL